MMEKEIALLRAENAMLRAQLSQARAARARFAVVDRVRERWPIALRALGAPARLLAVLVILLLLLAATLAIDRATRIPITVSAHGLQGAIVVDGETHVVRWTHRPLAVEARPPDPGILETGLDGADGLTEINLQPDAMLALQATPYGAFDAWMRGQAGLSQWRDLRLVAGGRTLSFPMNAPQPVPSSFTLTGAVERLEAAPNIAVHEVGGGADWIRIDRSGRVVGFTYVGPDAHPPAPLTWYVPHTPWPHLATVLRSLIYALDWALVLLALVALLALASSARLVGALRGLERYALRLRRALALLALLGGVGIALYVSRVDYDGRPHIVDAQAYLMQARILASGHTALALSQDVRALLPGPFFGLFQGSLWASQYGPGNPLALAVGVLLGAPWLPDIMFDAGMLALLWWVARRLFGPGTATLTVALAALSPFHAFMVGSYMSHVPSAFFIVLGYALLIRGGWARSARLALPAGCAIGAAALCRELTGAALGLYLGAVLLVACLRARRFAALFSFAAGGAVCAALYALYSWSITGNPLVSPRAALNPSDSYGFGPGHGWWGLHTVAAGLVNLDQQTVGLLVDLNGWPYFLSFSLALLPFVTRRAAWSDAVHLGAALVVLLSTVGYFYHGIVYGPRYVYEAAPFLFLLQARGAGALAATAAAFASRLGRSPRLAAPLVGALLLLLTIPGVTVVMARQLTVYYAHFNGDNGATNIDHHAIYDAAPRHAVVLTDDGGLYGNMLFALNDPANFLHPGRSGGTVWGVGGAPADYATARRAFPRRALYIMHNDGVHVWYTYQGGPKE